MTDTSWYIPDPDAQPEFYADIPMKRLFAFLVDTVLIVLICLVLLPFTAFTGLFFFPAMMLVVGYIYRVTTIANGSATLGMRLFAIEFRTGSGEKFDLSHAALHTACYSGFWLFLPLQVCSVILMATGSRGQGLADHMLGTLVLNRRALR